MIAFENYVNTVLDTAFKSIIYSDTKLDFLAHEVDSSLKEEGFVDGKLYFKISNNYIISINLLLVFIIL